MLKSKVDRKSFIRLIQIFYESINLRQLISYSVRICGIKETDIPEMKKAGLNLFRACALFDCSVTPSLWCFSLVAPCHAEDLMKTVGFGLGINTMEGREQKHQQLSKYSKNTTAQSRWKYIFRHEYIQLIFLRENGFDSVRYRKRSQRYIPAIAEGSCKDCGLQLIDDVCQLCSSEEMKIILQNVYDCVL